MKKGSIQTLSPTLVHNSFKLKLIFCLGSLVGMVIIFMTYPKLQIVQNRISPHSRNTTETGMRVSVVQGECSNDANVTLYERTFISRDFLIAGSNKPDNSTAPQIQRVLNYRKLVLFAVNVMNLNGPPCFKYWANPLNILELEKTVSSSTVSFKIVFMIEPGHSPVRALVEQDLDFLNKPFQIGIQNELRLISYEILDPLLRNLSCNSSTLLDALNNKTAIARNEWKTTDSELAQWPPNAPMFVTNYFTYGTESFYLSSPRGKDSYEKYCNSGLKVLILIPSAPAHFLNRNIIRETYGNKTLLEEQKVGLLFFVGNSDNSTIQANVSKEIEKFNDIVQANFVDSYYNLTLKQLAVFNWYYTFCQLGHPDFSNGSFPAWIFKADDDYLGNINLTLQIVTGNPSAQLIGVKLDLKPFRWWNKFYTPKYLYAPNSYLTYMDGPGYIFQSQLIPQILQASLTVPIIPFEDAYITGMLASQIGVIYRIDIRNIPCPIQLQFTNNMGNVTDLWKKFKNQFAESKNCSYKIEAQILDPKI